MNWVRLIVAFIFIRPGWGASINDIANIGYATSNGGTTGGQGGITSTVSTLDGLSSAVAGDEKKIVIITGTIAGNTTVQVGPNTSLVGRNNAALSGIGLLVLGSSNVIIRNLKISKVLADSGDAIGIQASHNVWLDHLDLSSDQDHANDYYGGLLDITHGSYSVTVSYCRLYNHWRASLVGHSDLNDVEDKAITVTYALNVFDTLNSRTPTVRFGTGHIYNNYYTNINDGINTRKGAWLLVENNAFVNVDKPLYSTDGGTATARGNDFGGRIIVVPIGTPTPVVYNYTLVPASSVKSATGSAGATLNL